MDDEMMDAIEEKVQEALESALENKMDDLVDEIADEMEDRIQDIVDDAVSDSIVEYFSEGIEEFLSSHQLELKDGTVLQMRQKTRVMNPDKTKVLICYGGMKVDGRTLMIQTRISCWQDLCCFETSAEAIEALKELGMDTSNHIGVDIRFERRLRGFQYRFEERVIVFLEYK